MKCDCCGKELTKGNKEANILICKECAEKISQPSTLFYTTVMDAFGKSRFGQDPEKQI